MCVHASSVSSGTTFLFPILMKIIDNWFDKILHFSWTHNLLIIKKKQLLQLLLQLQQLLLPLQQQLQQPQQLCHQGPKWCTGTINMSTTRSQWHKGPRWFRVRCMRHANHGAWRLCAMDRAEPAITTTLPIVMLHPSPTPVGIQCELWEAQHW